MTLRIVHIFLMHVFIYAILFVLYMIFLNMHPPLISEIYYLQIGIAGRRRTAMRLPDNITIYSI